MGVKKLQVKLISHTENPLALIYSAFRQCYFSGYAGDLVADIESAKITEEVQRNLISSVLASGHDSPVEHVSFSFAVEGISRACSHQLVRHRLASYSQQSQRYCAESENFDFIMPPEIAKDEELKEKYLLAMKQAGQAYVVLKDLLITKVGESKAKEDARFVLPNAAETKIVLTMNCRTLLHFFSLRSCKRAQWEIRAMSDEMLAICKSVIPVLFEKAGAKCELLGYCPETEKFCCGRYKTKDNLLKK